MLTLSEQEQEKMKSIKETFFQLNLKKIKERNINTAKEVQVNGSKKIIAL